MAKKRRDLNAVKLEPTFDNVLVCREKDAKPYIEIFVAEPENVALENLGTICGILEITDSSEDSSYIVNYLISIIKKEYFARAKRGSIESFEAALHKANLALSKLAEHGSVNWIGHLHAICAAVEKNNVHIAKTGQTSAFLLRNKSLANITAADEEDRTDPSPMKTFVDVMSGRIEDGDKIIMTTDAIFEIFSEDEIKRSALKFSQDNFMRFLKTALGNELPRAAVLITDISEHQETAPSRQESPKEEFNAFSQQAWQKKKKARPQDTVSAEEKTKLILEIKEEMEKKQDEFVDKITGHIYIKDGPEPAKEKSSFVGYLDAPKEKASDIYLSLKNRLASFHFSLPLPNGKANVFKGKKAVGAKLSSAKDRLGKFAGRAKSHSKSFSQKCLYIIAYKIALPAWSALGSMANRVRAKKISYRPDIPRVNFTRVATIAKPDFSKLKNILSRLDYSKKLYLALALIAIFIFPYFIARYWETHSPVPVAQTEEPAPQIPLSEDKNVVRISQLDDIGNFNGALDVVNLNGKIFAVGPGGILDTNDQKVYPLPDNVKNTTGSFGMDDLNILLVWGEKNNMSAWSPTSKKYQDSNISLPDETVVKDTKTFMTYAYVLDPRNNQIWRYPRAEGGFGDKLAWLKDSADIKNAVCMAVNDNIYVATENNIMKFFKGKKQDFSVEPTDTPITIDDIYTKPDYGNLYVMDKANARIIKLDADGMILAQYTNDEIKNAVGFTVSEENNRIYFATGDGIRSFEMQ